MRHFSSALGWYVNQWCLLCELCLIFQTKKIKLGSLVKFLLSNKSLQTLQQPPACSPKWTRVGGYRERKHGSWWGRKASGVGEGQRDVGNLLEERYNEGSRAVRVRPSSAPTPGDVLVSQAPDPGLLLAMGPNQFFRKLFGQVNLRTTMLFKSYNETKLLSESDYW